MGSNRAMKKHKAMGQDFMNVWQTDPEYHPDFSSILSDILLRLCLLIMVLPGACK